MIGRYIKYESGFGGIAFMRISAHKFDGDIQIEAHSKDAGEGRRFTLMCKCGSNDWTDNGRFINEYECNSCTQYVEAYEHREQD